MKLSDGAVGKSYSVKNIDLSLKVKRRLEILGMTGNASVDVLNSKKSGTKIIKVRGTRFALGKSFAEGIEVEEI
ncbi:MAG: FeoA domain-containing protein [Clostridia bacterium]|nr:FeoA domain-containing protein [Clostridia bacterium]